MITKKHATEDIVCMTVIAGRKKKISLLDAIIENGGKLVNVEFGLGSAYVSLLNEAIGFDPENKKVIIICLMKRCNSEKLLHVLVEKYHFDKPNTGIAYTVALDKLSF